MRILDLTRAIAGPACTNLMAEMGAEVIKIEGAPHGDLVRAFSVYRNGRSIFYVQQNRRKKSVCVDLRTERGRALLADLVPHVDVVVENYRPGMLERLGLAYPRLAELKPDIVLCSISAFGQEGALATRPGYDYIAQAYSGITSMIGDPDDSPCIPTVAIGDVSTGTHAALAILAALRHRDQTGEGQQLDISLLDVYYSYHEAGVHQYSGTDGEIVPTRHGRHMSYICPSGVFRGKTGDVMLIGGARHWPDLCRAMDRPELASDPAYATDDARLERESEIEALVETFLSSFSSAGAAVEHLERHDVPVAPILTVPETMQHPHIVERGTVRTVHDRLHGDFQIPGPALRFSRFPAPLELEAPTLGEHNDEVLSSLLGLSTEEIATLKRERVIADAPT